MGSQVPGDRTGLAAAMGTGDPVLRLSTRGTADHRIIYTTNAIESLNSKLRTAVRSRGHFPNDEAATKLLFLVLRQGKWGAENTLP